MKKILLFYVFVQLMWNVVAQEASGRSAGLGGGFVHALVDRIEQRLSEMKLPYRGYGFQYEILYIPQVSSHIFRPKDVSFDTAARDSINDLLSVYLRGAPNDLVFGGQLRFDEYTDHVFLTMSVLDKALENNTGFGRSVFVQPEPPKGMRAFYNRWVAYLSEKKSLGLLRLDSLMSTENLVIFKIGQDGTLSNLDTTSLYHQLVGEFLEREERWSPAVYRGRPLSTKITFRMPTERNWENYRTNIDWNLRMDFYSDKHEKDNVFMTRFYTNHDQKINMVSMVKYKGKYVAPVIHKGDIQQSKALIEFLQADQGLPNDHHAKLQGFYREYFYTEMK